MTRMGRTGVALRALATAGALALAACGGKPGEDAQAKPASATDTRTVRVARVENRSVQAALSVSGQLVAREEAAVGTEVTGYRIARVLADEGQWVNRGQTLAVIDPTLLSADVAAQRAQVQRAQAALQLAQVSANQSAQEAARVAGLDGQGVLSQEAIEQRRSQAATARANVAAARADVAAAQAQLQQVQTRLSRTSIAAPVSGRVLERNARPGEISAGGAPLFRIARDGLVELDAEVAETQLARIRPGQTARVTLPSGGVVDGTVRYVDPTVDLQSRLGHARISLPPREDLRLGGFAGAAINDMGAAGKVVPEAAVQFDADGAYVMVVGADNRVRRAPVRTGRRVSGQVELVQGPPEGAMVVLSGAAFIVEGDRVRPVLAAAAAQPAAARPAAAAPAGRAAR